jgi:hypothetical protein
MLSWRFPLRNLIATLLLIALLGCGLATSRYTTTNLPNGDADTNYTAARTVLSTNNGSGDVSCDVSALSRNGDVSTFTTGNGIVNSQSDFNTIIGLAGFTKVVNQINWCGTISPNWIGCTPTPGSSMLVVRYTANQEGILWAHEYGHSRGLNHRNDSDAIMNPVIGTNRTKVNQTECDSYRK